MKKLRTTRISLSLVIVFLSLAAAGAMWILFRTIISINDTNGNATDASNQIIVDDDIYDFNSCINAGNPIMETYPEQCRYNGRTYTNLDQLDSNNSQQGTRVVSGKRGFSMVVPDGMALIRDKSSDNFVLQGQKQFTRTPGVPALITDVEVYGTDSPSVLAVFIPGAYGVAPPEGDEESIVLGGLSGSKFTKRYTEDTERGMGQRDAGDIAYEYRLTFENGTELAVWYNIYADIDATDNVAVVEAMLASIRIP